MFESTFVSSWEKYSQLLALKAFLRRIPSGQWIYSLLFIIVLSNWIKSSCLCIFVCSGNFILPNYSLAFTGYFFPSRVKLGHPWSLHVIQPLSQASPVWVKIVTFMSITLSSCSCSPTCSQEASSLVQSFSKYFCDLTKGKPPWATN